MAKKILIVDDEPDILRLLDRALTMRDLDVLTTGSALEALLLLQDNPVSMLITDVRMPGMDGLDLISQVREINPDIPIVVISGYGDFTTAVEALERGAFYFINKPFNMQTIHEVVLKGLRLPTPESRGGAVIPYARHNMEFYVPLQAEYIEGINRLVCDAMLNMEYQRRLATTITPFIIDELFLRCIENLREREEGVKARLNVEIASEKVSIMLECPTRPFVDESYPPAFEELDFAKDQLVGMIMVRYFADELRYGDNGAVVTAALNKNRKPHPLAQGRERAR